MMILKLKEEQEACIRRLNQGDERAFEQLFRLFYPALCFFTRRILPLAGAAEEVAQDSLFKAWQRHADFRSFDALKAFLYISAKNACLDSLDQENRKNNREHHYYLDQPEVEKAIDQEMIYAEVLLEISNAIDELPEQCRKIMKHLFEEGKKAKDIAAELDISVSTVNNQKARGIALLKDKLGNDSFSTLYLLISIEALMAL